MLVHRPLNGPYDFPAQPRNYLPRFDKLLKQLESMNKKEKAVKMVRIEQTKEHVIVECNVAGVLREEIEISWLDNDVEIIAENKKFKYEYEVHVDRDIYDTPVFGGKLKNGILKLIFPAKKVSEETIINVTY